MSHRITALFLLAFSIHSFGQTEILGEDFQNGMPSDWTLIDVDMQIPAASVSEYTSAWIIKSDPENPSDSVVSSTSYYTPEGQANKWLISPPITLGAYGNILSWEAKSHDPSYPESYKVLVSTTDTDITSFTDTVGLVHLENPEWTSRETNLSFHGFNSQVVYIAFVNFTNEGFKLYLDDIHIRKEDPVGLEEIALNNVRLFPNPSKEEFRISSESPVDHVSIWSPEGKQLKSITYINGQSVNISDLPNGIYLVRLASGNAICTLRLLKN